MRIFCIIFASIVINFSIFYAIEKIFLEQEIHTKIDYSPVINDFIVSSYNITTKEIVHKDTKGKILDEDAFIYNLPFEFYQYLSSIKNFPNDLDFFAQDISLITENSQEITIKRDDLKFDEIPLYTLFESKPKMLLLKYPDELLRAKEEGVEFVTLENLKINNALSNALNAELKSHNFAFPMKGYFSNPNARKPFDEGAFILDSEDKIFHLKLINGELVLIDTGIVQKDIVYIKVDEHPRREFYALMLIKSSLHLIGYDRYNVIALPSEGLDYRIDEIDLEVTPLHRILRFKNSDRIKVFVLHPDYSSFKEFTYPIQKAHIAKQIREYLFPLLFNLDVKNGHFTFVLESFCAKSLIFSSLLGIVFLLKRRVHGFFTVLFLGIGGLISLVIWIKKS